jgi:hypothetical protein
LATAFDFIDGLRRKAGSGPRPDASQPDVKPPDMADFDLEFSWWGRRRPEIVVNEALRGRW